MAHPNLFPTATAHQRFLHILEDSIKDLVEKRKQKEYQLAIDNFRLRANEIARREEQILQRINRPSFKPDLKPWEQFLLKGSPGSGVVLPPCPPNGYVQLMPIGGVALHLRWLRRRYMVAREFLQVSITTQTYGSSNLIFISQKLHLIFLPALLAQRNQSYVRLYLAIMVDFNFVLALGLPKSSVSFQQCCTL